MLYIVVLEHNRKLTMATCHAIKLMTKLHVRRLSIQRLFHDFWLVCNKTLNMMFDAQKIHQKCEKQTG